jgi:hypothetical protein
MFAVDISSVVRNLKKFQTCLQSSGRAIGELPASTLQSLNHSWPIMSRKASCEKKRKGKEALTLPAKDSHFGRCHPGTVEATEFGKRYGKNLSPRTWDGDKRDDWSKSTPKNWGCWSCCGGACNSPPCAEAGSRDETTTLSPDALSPKSTT